MNILLAALFLFATPPLVSLDDVMREANLERRAKLGVTFAASAEREAEANYALGDMEKVSASLKNMVMGIELAQEALQQTGKSPRRSPGPFKWVELRTQDIVRRLLDLEKRMDAGERSVLEGSRLRVQEIHDAWFEGLMSRKK